MGNTPAPSPAGKTPAISSPRWPAGRPESHRASARASWPPKSIRNGVYRIELHLDPARQTTPFRSLPELTRLSARPGETAVTQKTGMNWSSADTLLAEIPLTGGETILATVAAPGMGQATLAPMCLPYSPEYLPQKPGRGVAALEQLAKATGGCERSNLADVWKDIPKKLCSLSLAPYLLLVAVAVFLLEVMQRRTGLLSVRWKMPRLLRRKAASTTPRPTVIIPQGKPKSKEPVVPAAPQPARAAAEPSPEQAESDNEPMAAALSHAQRRARKRTERDI